MIEFNNTWLADTHGPIVVGAPEVPIRRAKYWDVDGEGEVVGLQGGRNLSCLIIVHNGFTTLSKFLKQIQKMDHRVGGHGTLEETGELERTFDHCTFEGYDPVALEGQDQPGPLPDVGVLLRANGSLDNGYFAAYMLRFRQLIVP